MSEPNWKPELCESCAAGKHRAHCATFPRPCEDLIEIYESGFAAGRAEQREADARIAESYARFECSPRFIAERIREGA